MLPSFLVYLNIILMLVLSIFLKSLDASIIPIREISIIGLENVNNANITDKNIKSEMYIIILRTVLLIDFLK